MIRACKKSRYVTAQNFRVKTIFSAGFISVRAIYAVFSLPVCCTFDRNLIHSVDACFLVMACVVYLHAQLKTLSSLLNELSSAY